MNTQRLSLALSFIGLFIAGCTSSALAPDSLPTFGNSGQLDPYSTGYNTSTVSSPTGTSAGSLFDTASGTSSTTASTGSSTVSNPTPSEVDCLTGAANSSACLGSQGSSQDAIMLQMYQSALITYQAVDFCYNFAVKTYAPKTGMTTDQVTQNVDAAEKGLVTCMRDIVQFQSSSLPWAQPQMAAYGNTDFNMWNLLSGLGFKQ